MLKPQSILEDIAGQQGVQTDDALGYYLNRVLQDCDRDDFEQDNATRNQIYHFVMRSNRYRRWYYLQDKNSAFPKAGTPINAALSRIADEKAVLAAGCTVPRVLPQLFVEPNVLVFFSKRLWRQEGVANAGMVDTYSTILPRKNVEFLLLHNLDHGALVLMPEVRGISVAGSYEQLSFIKTLLKRLATKIEEIPPPQSSVLQAACRRAAAGWSISCFPK